MKSLLDHFPPPSVPKDRRRLDLDSKSGELQELLSDDITTVQLKKFETENRVKKPTSTAGIKLYLSRKNSRKKNIESSLGDAAIGITKRLRSLFFITVALPRDSSSLKYPPHVSISSDSASFVTHQPAHDSAFDELQSIISPEALG